MNSLNDLSSVPKLKGCLSLPKLLLFFGINPCSLVSLQSAELSSYHAMTRAIFGIL